MVFFKLQLVMFFEGIRSGRKLIEPMFAEAKEWHGVCRLRLRGLRNANVQGLLIAAGQNLKRFLTATGWGRRNAPYGNLVAFPVQSGQFSAAYE